jgi:glycosyltransferase involved in cell wall biosynthesis
VRQYDCGFQCSPENREDVISAILKLKVLTPEERHAMGERGRKAVVREYTYRRLAERFLKETIGDTAG